MGSNNHDNSFPGVDDVTQRFALWALATLKLPVESLDPSVYAVLLPESKRAAFGGAESIRFTFDIESVEAYSPVECAALGSRVYCWLVDELRRLGLAAHAAPERQPAGVHEITPQLFEAFQVDGGSVHLRGCTFEDQPLLRFTYRAPADDGSAPERLVHLYAWTDGEPVEEELLDALHVDELVPPARPPRLADAEIEPWLDAGKRLAADRSSGGRLRLDGAVLDATTVIWCKCVVGKLAFVIGQNSVETTFSGWAQFFADRRVKPPPYACPLSGEKSYHLAATDDGRITVVEAIATCAESGERVLKADLETCEATGNRVLPAYLETCPVTGVGVARSCLVVCPSCRQRVAPATIEKGRCGACRSMQTVASDDPRLACVRDRYPKLKEWRTWRISETSTVYVLSAASLLRRLLVVVDKENLDPLHMAARNRFSQPWLEIPAAERDDHLL